MSNANTDSTFDATKSFTGHGDEALAARPEPLCNCGHCLICEVEALAGDEPDTE